MTTEHHLITQRQVTDKGVDIRDLLYQHYRLILNKEEYVFIVLDRDKLQDLTTGARPWKLKFRVFVHESEVGLALGNKHHSIKGIRYMLVCARYKYNVDFEIEILHGNPKVWDQRNDDATWKKFNQR